jgi:SAM-dependent methyltransferase
MLSHLYPNSSCLNEILMRITDLKYFNSPSPVAPLRFALDVILATRRSRRLAMLNRLRDYNKLVSNPVLLELHGKLNSRLVDAVQGYQGYDYGEGYFYQSLTKAGISGLRDTEARVKAMDLHRRLKDQEVLEIGCNTGFLSILVAETAKNISCIDINPYLIEIAKISADHIGCQNIQARAISFEEFSTPRKFDVVLSFANHSTYDGNTRQSVKEYLLRCSTLLRTGGLFLFESHSPEYEGDGLASVCKLIKQNFLIDEESVLNYGTFLDIGRTFIVARKK